MGLDARVLQVAQGGVDLTAGAGLGSCPMGRGTLKANDGNVPQEARPTPSNRPSLGGHQVPQKQEQDVGMGQILNPQGTTF